MKKHLLQIGLPIICAALLITGGFIYWHHGKLFPNTGDAYVQAHIVNIAPRVTGSVSHVSVSENQNVKKGQLLFTIDPTPFKIDVEKAESQLVEIQDKIKAASMAVKSASAKVQQSQAELTNTRAMTKRTLTLAKRGFASKADADNATKNLRVARASVLAAQGELSQALNQRGAVGPDNAQLQTAQAGLDQAKLNLSYTKVYAPAAGYIENFSLRRGDAVAAYQDKFALVETASYWVDANFKETQLQRIATGQPATITVDMYPNLKLKGKVISLSASSGTSFSLLPPQNASSNWVKVTQRFPVRVLITSKLNADLPLRIGASSTVTIDTQ